MNFKTSLRGYNKREVDSYINELTHKENNLLAAQKQHIDELADENFALRRQITTFEQNERAISQALVDANSLAGEVQGNAQKYAEVTLARAKLFYVAWSAYAKTLVATLSDEEVKRFNQLKDKVERAIDAYEGGSVASYAASIQAHMELDDSRTAMTAATTTPNAEVPQRPARRLTNPIEKVERAARQRIDLMELVKPTESLADLCRDLGMDVDETADK